MAYLKNMSHKSAIIFYLTRIIHGISFMQMRGVETRRNTLVFQGFCNEADA